MPPNLLLHHLMLIFAENFQGKSVPTRLEVRDPLIQGPLTPICSKITNIHRTNLFDHSKRIKIKFPTTFLSDIISRIAQERSYMRLEVYISSGKFSKMKIIFFSKLIQMKHPRVFHSKNIFSRIAILCSLIYCYTTSW